MRAVFADTCYWIALLNPKDQTHDIAVRVSKGLTECRIVTADPTSLQREPRPDVCCPAFCSRSRSRMLRLL